MFRWIDSFSDNWGTSGEFYTRKYRSADVSSSLNNGRYNGNAIKGGNQDEHFHTKILATETPEPDTWVVGFGFKIAENGGTGTTQNERVVGLTFFTNTEGSPIENQVTLMIERVTETTYKWELRRGPHQDDPLITGGTSNPFFANIWSYWELKIKIDPSTGWWELRKNGVEFFSGSGQDTAATGTAGADSIGFYLDSYNKWTTVDFSEVLIDDLYVLTDDGTGDGNDFVGNCQIEQILAIADDPVYTEWQLSEGSDHYALVNETGWSTLNDDKFIFSEDVGDIDLFRYNALTVLLLNIKTIQINTTAAMKASGSRKLKHTFNDNVSTPANLGFGDEEFLIDSVLWDTESEIIEDDPVNGGAFTKTILEDYYIGMKVTE